MRTATERRGRGGVVDLRIWLDRVPEPGVINVIHSALRRSDAVLSHEGREIAVALGGTSPENAARVVVPRLQEALKRQHVRCSFMVNGRRI